MNFKGLKSKLARFKQIFTDHWSAFVIKYPCYNSDQELSGHPPLKAFRFGTVNVTLKVRVVKYKFKVLIVIMGSGGKF